MEKKNFSILLILVFLTSLSDSDDYNYDDYAYYDEYNYYDEKYDYYGDQNLPAPVSIPILPPTPSAIASTTTSSPTNTTSSNR